ncbi:hypothetical protein PC9H_003303 [Pleurotus ostreatus]|uniref:Ubiquitin-like domain-containing protein n=1 Tax=Pleurotus ostreatus TaxID=5322 RepID=A0A8H7A5L6_PLEOS|nr:uncharacterized protein PC9H_003303 [Pleurotus ostreatus]KAF7436470.1 hypothetical protein PC9H_003303 [Pleurotus ostreatus]
MAAAVSAPNPTSSAPVRSARPPPGPAPPAPAAAPPGPPNHTHTSHAPPPNLANGTNAHTHSHTHNHNHTHTTVNGAHPQTQKGKKKANDAPVDPATMYETLKNRIAALEEEEVLEEEEERRFAEEAQKSVKGMGENAIHAKYIELFAELKRVERDHAKEKQKLVKDKDTAKGQLTKANQTKAKIENLARELQKDNKRLREDTKRMSQCVEDAQEELMQMKNDLSRRADKAKQQDDKFRESPDIVVKVVCRYRAELFFKIGRKARLSRLFGAWTERMEKTGGKMGPLTNGSGSGSENGGADGGAHVSSGQANGNGNVNGNGSAKGEPGMQFIFSHNGRSVEADQTPEDIAMEDGDEILAVELMDLTVGPGLDEWDGFSEPARQTLKKNWSENPQEARRTLEEIFDGVTRDRIKEVLRQYELRERHFECVIRSKELEVLLSRARATEQRALAEGEKARADKHEEEIQRLKKELQTVQNEQTKLIDKLIICCKEPSSERSQRLFASLREELEKKGGTKLPNGTVGS